jgi:parallel beta-helix repeat protein
MRFVIVLVTILAIPAIASSKTIHVPGDYLTIQEAIDAAVNGDTILVKPGRYVENIDFLGKAIELLSEQGPEVTEIDGNSAGSVAVFKTGEGAGTILSGFTVTKGKAAFGGGIYCNGSSPTISGNIIMDNSATSDGGGIFCNASHPAIKDNTISGNSADSRGGGIELVAASNPVISWNVIDGNSAEYCGGGICCDGGSAPEISCNTFTANTTPNFGAGILTDLSTPKIVGNTFAWNTSSTSAGAIYCHESSVTIAGNMIVNNLAKAFGGALIIDGDSSSLLLNNTISENTGSFWGGGLLCWDGAIVTITNTIFWNNVASFGPEINLDVWDDPTTVNISHSNVKGGQASVYIEKGCMLNWGPGMIDADPLFVDPALEDFHLTFNSPCRGSGDDSAVPPDLLDDFEGDPRIAYGTVDMGADEFYTHLYWTGDATPGGNVEVKFVGLPGTSPVGLCIGTGVLEPPIPSIWGDWYLQFPIIGPVDLGSITSPEGVLVIPSTIPGSPPAPYSIPMQALIGDTLTNLCVIKVK